MSRQSPFKATIEKKEPMQPRSFTGELVLGLFILALVFAGLIAVSYAISALIPALGPPVANILWATALLGMAITATRAQRWGRAAAPVAFIALWAAGTQINAGFLSAQTGTRDGLTSVPDVRPVSRLIVNASYGLPIDPTRSGGIAMARFDECSAWCRDLILNQGMGSIVLWTPKPEAPTARTLFRKGGAGECTAAAPCIVEESAEAFPDGLMIEMGDEAGPASSSNLCCPVAVVSKIEGGNKTVLKSYRQGLNLAIMPLPVIAATGKPFETPPVMQSNVELGPPLRFDTLIEALLDTQLTWK
jgi:hypothetical protein